MSDFPLLPTTIIAAASDALAAEFGEELVVLNAETGIYYGLEEVGARIWSLLKQPTTFEAIRNVITSEYEVEADDCERDLIDLLRHLNSVGLVKVK
jgi:hypothetical protein